MVLTVCTRYSIIAPDIVLLFPVWSVSTLSRRATDHKSEVSVYILYQTAIPGPGRLITITNHKSSSIFLTSPFLETFRNLFLSVISGIVSEHGLAVYFSECESSQSSDWGAVSERS